jgi:hypothetical protein
MIFLLYLTNILFKLSYDHSNLLVTQEYLKKISLLTHVFHGPMSI